MNNFLKRNREIKLFTIGWLLLMTVIASILLFCFPSTGYEDSEFVFISEADKFEVTVIEISDSDFFNQLVILNNNFHTNTNILTQMSSKVYKFEVYSKTGRNGDIKQSGSVNILFVDNNLNSEQRTNGYPLYGEL
jgi:hypothetical protein